MLEVVVLIISIIILIIIIRNNNIEPFYGSDTFDEYYLTSCPAGYTSFYNNNGDIICCNGEVIVNKCIGDVQCTLNGKGTPNMPNCVKYILENYREKGEKVCPRNYSYFEGETKGCTDGLLNNSLTGPLNTTQKVCKIYPTDILNKNSINSCYNQRMLEEANFGEGFTKMLTQIQPNTPVVVEIKFIANNIPKTAYTRKSYEDYLNVVNPKWDDVDKTYLYNNIHIAEVAKAHYIDRTLAEADVDFT